MRTLIINKDWPKVSVLYTDPTLIIKNLCREFSSDIACDYVENDFEDILMILQPAVCMTADTIRDFISAGIPAKLKSGNDTVAIFMPLSYHSRIDIHDIDEEQLKTFYLPAEESFCATDAMNTYLCNETLRNRINEQLLNKGVYIADVATAVIAPFVQIEEGAAILPNCQIYGLSTIKKGSVIGPNAVISDSCIGENTKINASQVFESSVGCDTTVGPFAYIRPKSDIGDNVKIGDYVEIKKSTIGNGTKISHFAYIGDSEIGSKVNFSCGAITVNYDGKNKYKTKVGDNCFIGCNVNLVAPVEIGDGAFVAAGSTVTENVPPDALTVARSRQYTKADWAKKRREDGKL